TVGVVFSSTNYSLAPHEMMACGLPVVELASESSVLEFPPDAITLAQPTPHDIADKIERLLDDHELREAQARHALAYVQPFTWERASKDVERAIVRTIEAQEALRDASVQSPVTRVALPPGRPRRARPPAAPKAFEGPIVFAAQPEYYRSSYFDLVAT